MKIRIKDNSIRLRLTQSEVAKYEATGSVEALIQFGIGNVLHYNLLKSDHQHVSATFNNNTIEVSIPHQLAHQWASTDEVGIEYLMPIDTDNHLRILVEKDFKCLTVRTNEDETDAFPHPNEHQLAC